ncbi:hypothetical protein ONS95_003033 [Cadophora gregata]|uniref:uncharacterized protein n=1 Tax=Cadophora gregata TaxID=51156 RepID=UPI0026DD704D|nr:uncharacterized protein ONS95_003033 [Cadophora gregata]KAK0108213.1 hypothetical protein ONS95_003033 [Cadophora gregata]
MRFTQFLSLGLACLTTATPVPEAAPGSTHSLQERATYPSTSGLKFNIDGKVAYFAGSNSYWIGFLTNNADVDLVMSHLKASGLKVLRIWGFNDVTQTSGGVWFQSFVAGQQPVINTGANGLQRLDYVVKSAESHGIKLIINFVNNWGDYGGMLAYNNYFKTTKTTWYSDSRVQAQYQAYIKAVVSRYLTSPAIFAWELANEPRCNGCPTSVVTNWVTKTSNYIKGLDPNHMITLGDEGWLKGGGDGSYPFTTAEGVDFEANLRVANISFGTFHLYPTQCKHLPFPLIPLTPIFPSLTDSRGTIKRACIRQHLDQRTRQHLCQSRQTLHLRRIRHRVEQACDHGSMANDCSLDLWHRC